MGRVPAGAGAPGTPGVLGRGGLGGRTGRAARNARAARPVRRRGRDGARRVPGRWPPPPGPRPGTSLAASACPTDNGPRGTAGQEAPGGHPVAHPDRVGLGAARRRTPRRELATHGGRLTGRGHRLQDPALAGGRTDHERLPATGGRPDRGTAAHRPDDRRSAPLPGTCWTTRSTRRRAALHVPHATEKAPPDARPARVQLSPGVARSASTTLSRWAREAASAASGSPARMASMIARCWGSDWAGRPGRSERRNW